jgi:hypothetical protein
VPHIIQNFFLVDFSLNNFKKQNEVLIRDYAIENYVKTKKWQALYPIVTEMIYENNYKKKLKIHREFPAEKLVETLRPYILLHYKSKFSIGPNKKNKYARELREKMKRFVLFNPNFGRKITNIINQTSFIDFSIESQKTIPNLQNIKNEYMKSHLNYDSDGENEEHPADYVDNEGYDSF